MTAYTAMAKRSLLWRIRNPITVVLTIIQPLIWLVVFIPAARGTLGPDYAGYLLPGLLMLTSFSCAGSCGIMNYFMKRTGVFRRILGSPASRIHLAAGPVAETVAAGLFEMLVLALVSLAFGVRFRTQVPSVLCAVLLLTLSACSMSCIAYLFSLLLPDEEVFETVMNMIALPIFFTSGSLFRPATDHSLIAAVIRLNPYQYVVRAARPLLVLRKTTALSQNSMLPADIFSGAFAVPSAGTILFPLILFTVLDILLFVLCVRRLRRLTL